MNRTQFRQSQAFWYLHSHDRSCWTHELQLTPVSDQSEFLSRIRGIRAPSGIPYTSQAWRHIDSLLR